MPRYIWDKTTERFVPAGEMVRRNPARSHLPTPRIIHDGIEVKSMLDGKMYSSKTALRQTYRAAGVEEVGNEPMDTGPREITTAGGIRDDLHKAFAEHS